MIVQFAMTSQPWSWKYGKFLSEFSRMPNTIFVKKKKLKYILHSTSFVGNFHNRGNYVIIIAQRCAIGVCSQERAFLTGLYLYHVSLLLYVVHNRHRGVSLLIVQCSIFERFTRIIIICKLSSLLTLSNACPRL